MDLWGQDRIYLIIIGSILLLFILVCILSLVLLNQRKKIHELRDTIRKKPDQLFHKAIEIEEVERQKISRILKNITGSASTSSKYQPVSLNSQSNRSTAVHYFQQTSKQDTTLINTIMDISSNLHSNVLRQFGFNEAIRHFATKITDGSGITPSFQLDDSYKDENNARDITLYRILQELLLNIMKHASPSMLSITSGVNENELELIIISDGNGISHQDYETLVHKQIALGLQNIHNRIDFLSGRIHFEFNKGVQKIFIYVPLYDYA
jgi:Signal transduction histidine kinase